MNINTEYIEFAKKIISNYNQPDIKKLSDIEIKNYLHKYGVQECDVQAINDILVAYRMMASVQNIEDYETILSLIIDNRKIMNSLYYFGYLMVKDRSFNIFKYFSSLKEPHAFWSTYHVFSEAFDVAPICEMNDIIVCIEKCLIITNNDFMQGNFFHSLNRYFIKHAELNQELIELLIVDTDENILPIMPFLISNAYCNQKKAFHYIDTMLKSKNTLLISVACHTCGVLYLKHSDGMIHYLDQIIGIIEKYNADNACVGNALQFLLYVVALGSTSLEKKKQLMEIVKNNINLHPVLNQSILTTIVLRFNSFDSFAMEIMDLIFPMASINDHRGTSNYYDQATTKLVQDGNYIKAIDLMKSYYVSNIKFEKKLTLERKFTSTFYSITESLQAKDYLIKRLFRELLSRNNHNILFALEFLHSEDVLETIKNTDLPDWLSPSDCLLITKTLTAFCFQAKFICFMGIKLLTNEPLLFREHVDFYLEEVCDNYWDTALNVAKEYLNPSQLQSRMICEIGNHISNKQNLYKSILDIKDLHPSNRRNYLYQIEMLNFNQEIMKQADEHSVFMQLVTRQAIKYGKRHAYIVKGADQHASRESGFAEFSYSFPLPIKYLKDPYYLFCLKHSILKGGGLEDETGS